MDYEVISCQECDYRNDYKSHCLEIYKLYVEMADRISSRRQTANSFFLSINTALVAFIGFASTRKGLSSSLFTFALTCIAGIVLSFFWYRIVRSYKGINSGKFKVIHKMEKHLPFKCYSAEWDIVGKGKVKKLYLPVSHIEMFVPWVFISIYIILSIVTLYYYFSVEVRSI